MLIKYLLLIGISLALFSPAFAQSPTGTLPVTPEPVVEAPKPAKIAVSRPVNPQKGDFVAYAEKRAVEANLRPERVVKVIDCETAGTWDPSIQSEAIYKRSNPALGIVAGTRERSFGLAQIHLPADSSVTYEQAIDPYFAIDFLIREWEKGNQWRWTCWKTYYG